VPEYFTSLGGTQGLELANGAGAILQPTATGFNVSVFRPGGVTPAQAKQWQWNVNWRAVPKNQVNAQLCSGSTTAGSTNWVQAPNGRIYVDVNTAACGVFFTPRYFTSLKGALMTHLMNGVTTVYSPTATGFRIYLQWGLAANPAALTPGLANSWQWHVGWSAVPSLAANSATQCAGSTASGFWNWTQAGTDTIYTDVNTSACGRTFTPLYFSELRGNGAVAQSSAVGTTTIRNLTPTSFRVYLRHPGLTPLLAGINQYHLDWSAHP
jgi:hypothetical protein